MRPGPDPIGDYALLSDSHGSALVSRGGSIDWACLPRFDRPSVFARILGRDAGHWRISPTGTTEVKRAYLDETMVLQTLFRTPSGTAALIDAMPFGPSEREHRIGRHSPHAIVRVVKGLEGEAELELEFRPRPEYGLTTPMLLAHPGGLRTPGWSPRLRVVLGDCAGGRGPSCSRVRWGLIASSPAAARSVSGRWSSPASSSASCRRGLPPPDGEP
jgi:GH15 family glucan-1,4-alpha-glucosidase